MLFTDSDLITSADLVRIDSEVPSVAATGKLPIVIDGPGSICELAWSECAQQLAAAQQMYAGYLVPWGVSGGHTSAVLNTGVGRTQPRVRTTQIVANDWNYSNSQSPVQQWLTYTALMLFYRDAAARIENDRYDKKYQRYMGMAQARWRTLKSTGLPTVYLAMEAPGAKHAFNPGTWDDSNVTMVGAAPALGGSFSVAITYLDSSKYTSQSSKGNAESGPSVVIEKTLAAGNALSVSIASLNPPTGAMDAVGTSQGSWTPLNATHWNLWAGAAAGPLYLQQELIPIATKTASLATDPVLSGSMLGSGQFPDIQLVFQNLVMRG